MILARSSAGASIARRMKKPAEPLARLVVHATSHICYSYPVLPWTRRPLRTSRTMPWCRRERRGARLRRVRCQTRRIISLG